MRTRRPIRGTEPHAQGRLLARQGVPTKPASPGLHPLGLAAERDGLLYVPAGYSTERPAPLVLMLHGAGGNAHHALAPLLPVADALGLLLLAPDSRLRSWDIIARGEYGRDIAFIDSALVYTFERCAVDPARIAIEGFSDGASYALSVGVANGRLFTHVIAFSPGFLAPPRQEGEPRLFISHGIHDTVLPIDPCSRRIVPQVQQAGYDVRYHEFDGGHVVPPDVVRAALDWFLA